jgi:hypothetical protein
MVLRLKYFIGLDAPQSRRNFTWIQKVVHGQLIEVACVLLNSLLMQ